MKRRIAVAVTVLACVACAPDYQGNKAGPKTVMIGDSITAESADWLHFLYDPQWSFAVWGTPQKTVEEMQPAATTYQQKSPQRVVIELGTNDVWRGLPVEVTIQQLHTMAGKFPAACVAVLTVTESTPWENFNVKARPVNDRIRAEFDHVGDWAAVLEQNPGWTPDGLHPNDWGKMALAGVVETALRGC